MYIVFVSKLIEIILVDDGSNDNSGKLCDKLSETDGRIKVVHQKNAGVAGARRTGFNLSTGGVITFVDSDDYIELDMYEIMLKKMDETNSDIVFCDYNSVTKEKTDKRYFLKEDKILTKFETLKYLANDEIKSFMCNKLYKRKILKESDFYVGKLMEDYLCMTDIFNRCNTVSYVHGTFYNYVRRDSSIMGNKSNMFKYWEGCKFRLDWYEKNYPEYISLCLNRAVRVALTCFENKNLNLEQKYVVKKFLKENDIEILKNTKLNIHKKLKVLYFLYF